MPYVIVFGGTDLNEHYKNGEKLNVMTNAVEKARYMIFLCISIKSKSILSKKTNQHRWKQIT